MQRLIVTVPAAFLRFISVDWDIDWRGQSLGENNGGGSQVVYNRFPRWVGTPSIILQGSAIAGWRAIRAEAQGRVGIYRIPMCDPAGFHFSATGAGVPAAGIPFSEGPTFESGYGFAYEPRCTASASAAAGATSILVEDSDAVPVPGQIMSANSWPFVVTSVTEVSSGVYDLTVQMPLRAAISAGDTVLLRGEGLFEAVEDSMGRPSYGAGRLSKVKLSFREVLNR